MDQEFYTASQAIKLLGLSKTEFHRKVNNKQIPKVTQPGRKHGLYPKRDIDALAFAMNLVFDIQERVVFSKSTPGDQVEEMNIGIQCFGTEYIAPLPERIEFQQKSEFTFWSLKVDGHVTGYMTTFRFSPEFLDDILTGKRTEKDITTREILTFTRLEPFDIYIDIIAVDPRLPHHLRSLYAGIIISRFANMILDLRNNSYLIRTLYVVATTPEGDNLARKLGFQLMEEKSKASGRIAYKFDLDDKGIEHIKEISRRKLLVEKSKAYPA